MNITSDKDLNRSVKIDQEIADKVVGAISSVSQREWMEFFEFLRQVQYGQITSAGGVEHLQTIQNTVKSYQNLEHIFKGISRDKKLA